MWISQEDIFDSSGESLSKPGDMLWTNYTQLNTWVEIEKIGSFGNIMEYGTSMLKEEEDILLIR